MKNNMKSILLGVLTSSVLILTGCTTDSMVNDDNITHTIPIDLSEYSDQYEACPKITTESLLDCNEQNGSVQKEGMMGCYTCVTAYADAGKTCQDASDCQGECTITGEFLEYGLTNQSGQCEANDSPFGCFQTIENGVAGNALCVD